MLLFTFNPILGVGKALLDKFSSSKDQGKIANELIRKRKENGVDKMIIKLNNTKGLDLSLKTKGIEIKTFVGSTEETIVDVTYR